MWEMFYHLLLWRTQHSENSLRILVLLGAGNPKTVQICHIIDRWIDSKVCERERQTAATQTMQSNFTCKTSSFVSFIRADRHVEFSRDLITSDAGKRKRRELTTYSGLLRGSRAPAFHDRRRKWMQQRRRRKQKARSEQRKLPSRNE